MIKFLDTNALLHGCLPESKFYISSITLKELENIKTSANKDGEIKYQARKLLIMLDSNELEYEVIIFNEKMLRPIEKANLPINDDARIIACALSLKEEVEFITNDMACKNIAKLFFKNVSSSGVDIIDDYSGYQEVVLNDELLCDFYSNLNKNWFNSLTNEYVLIRDSASNAIDSYCWDGEKYRKLKNKYLSSQFFGDIKPIKGDFYQAMAIDSLMTNKLTMLRGPAGSGKSFLGLGYLFALLEKGKIDKIIIFCNTVAAKGAAKLGYYPGSKDEKLLDSQLGNFLVSKLGDMIMVEKYISEGKLLLVPMADCRGMDLTGMNAGVYFTEAQNTTTEMMKLFLQRLGDDSICVIDGDDKTQVDMADYEGANNGMKRASKVFRGKDIYGEVVLRNIHRSRIARIAEEM